MCCANFLSSSVAVFAFCAPTPAAHASWALGARNFGSSSSVIGRWHSRAMPRQVHVDRAGYVRILFVVLIAPASLVTTRVWLCPSRGASHLRRPSHWPLRVQPRGGRSYVALSPGLDNSTGNSTATRQLLDRIALDSSTKLDSYSTDLDSYSTETP